MWNCSQKISRLYTCFYSGIDIINKLDKLEKAGLLDSKIKVIPLEYCNVNLIPLNKLVMKFYQPIENKNKRVWNDLEKEVEKI